MAKLSARGRTVLVRMIRERMVRDTVYGDMYRERVTYALMSDQCILRKVVFWWESNNKRSDSGWKNLGKTKETPEEFERRLGEFGFYRADRD